MKITFKTTQLAKNFYINNFPTKVIYSLKNKIKMNKLNKQNKKRLIKETIAREIIIIIKLFKIKLLGKLRFRFKTILIKIKIQN
jgi:hypothetical protein